MISYTRLKQLLNTYECTDCRTCLYGRVPLGKLMLQLDTTCGSGLIYNFLIKLGGEQ